MPQAIARALTLIFLATFVAALALSIPRWNFWGLDVVKGQFERLELFFIDQRYLDRARIDPQAVPVCDKICIIVQDDASCRVIEDHPMDWLPHYARVLDGVLDAGATVVGLDVMTSHLPAQHRQEVLLTVREHRDRIVLPCLIHNDGWTDMPLPELVAVAGRESLGLVNVFQDQDGVWRSQHIYPTPSRNADEMEAFPIFSALLAERHLDQQLDPESRRLGNVFLPGISADDPRLRINFAGAPVDTPFPEYSFHEVLKLVLEGRTDELRRRFNGKVVLIGSTRARDQDLVQTPFSLALQQFPDGPRRVPMFGIRGHAHVLNTLLTGSFVRSPAPEKAALAVWLVTLLAALAAFRLSPAAGAATGLLSLVAYWVAADHLFLTRSLLIPVAPVVVSVPLMLTVVYGYRYWFDEAEKRQIRAAFSRYVSSDVMEEMLKFPQNYRPDRVIQREMTVMFSDINGFSTVCEGRSAEEVTRMLNEHFVEMTNVIFSHRGTLIRFNGDEFMVLFGAPRPQPEPEKDAVRCAVEMVERLAEMKKADPTGKNGFYEVKIGINSGKMILTSIGSAQRSDYNAIGDSANLASRVMSLAKQEGVPILISESAYEKARWMPDIDFRCQGEFQVKGREGKVRVYCPSAVVNSP